MCVCERVVRDHSCGGMIYYASEGHERGSWSYGDQVGRVGSTNLLGQYHVVMS